MGNEHLNMAHLIDDSPFLVHYSVTIKQVKVTAASSPGHMSPSMWNDRQAGSLFIRSHVRSFAANPHGGRLTHLREHRNFALENG